MLRPLPLVAAALVASAAFAAPKPKQASKGPVYQPTAVGTKWVYDDHGKDWTQEIVDAVSRDGETVLSIRINDNFNVTVAVTATGVFDRGAAGFAFDTCQLKLPVTAGQTWEVSIAPQPGLLDFAGTMTVGRPEKVEVPAGTFEAIPVRLEQTSQNGKKLDTPEVTTCWWAEGVGVVRLQSGTTDRKLKTFIPVKKD
jgi:hypothetical protein